MAKISLRSYQREIENLIEGSQIEEAIAHCRYILSTFPKHIDTYRLLGKAYLEVQRYGDAADVFQRVLSTVPDDFVAHLGMSIVREDEGNLNEAIWHMERAFEVQPSNSAVQSELRRLYGRRDGLEPPRIRLTRGALARMYMKGGLYQQAVAELRAALLENPQRLDLQLLLGTAYSLAGQKVEAAEIFTTLLHKLPYCLEANRIMVDILSGTEHTDENRIYRQRLQALDPYFAFLGVSVPTIDKVPDQAVTMERMVWSPGLTGKTGQPLWASSLGIDLADEKTSAEPVPDWLATEAGMSEEPLSSLSGEESDQTGIEESQEKIEKSTGEGEEASSEQTPDWLAQFSDEPVQPVEEEIPEWLKAAGWEPATGSVDEAKTVIEVPEEESQPVREDELASAEIPEWLREIAPSETASEEPAEAVEGDAAVFDLPDWLKESEGIEEPALTEMGPDLTTGVRPGEEGPQATITSPEEELPGEADVSAAKAGVLGTAAVGAEAAAWASETEDKEVPEEAAVLSDQVPEILPEAEGQEAETGQVAPEAEAYEEPTTVEETMEPASLGMDDDTAFAWLESLAAKQGAEEGELLLQPEERQENPPDWVVEAAAEAIPEEEPKTEAVPEEELPDWLKELHEEPPEVEVPISPASETIPSWLSEIGDQPISEEAVPVESEAETIPSWLSALQDQDETAQAGEEGAFASEPEAAAEAEEPAESEALIRPAGAAIFDSMEEDETGKWLESLTATPAESEAEPAQAPLETPSEWVPELPIEEQQATVMEFEAEETTLGAPAEAELPDWLLELQSTKAEEEVPEVSMEAEPAETLISTPPVEDLFKEEVPDYLADTKPVRVKPAVISQPVYEEPSAPTILSRPEEVTAAEEEVFAEGEGVEAVESITTPVEAVEVSVEAEQPGEGEPPEAEVETAFTDEVSVEEAELFTEEAPGLPFEELEEAPVPEEAAFEESITEQAAEVEQPVGEAATSSDEEAAFAWLESLAAKQGAEEEELLLTPEERTELPPEWVVEEVEAEEAAPTFEIEEAEEPLEPSEPVTEETAAAAVPDWLKEFETPIEEVERPFEEKPDEVVVSAMPEEEAEEAVVGEAVELPVEDMVIPSAELIEEEQGYPELPSWLAEEAEIPSEAAEWTPPEVIGPVPPRKFELNQASLAELERLPGVGFIMAQQIVSYRDEHGPFHQVDELLNVQDFSPALLEDIRERLYVEAPSLISEPIEEVEEQPAEEEQIPVIEIDEQAPEELRLARQDLQSGMLDEANKQYISLVRARQHMDKVVADLQYATQLHPQDSGLWQTLGDAYLRLDRLQEALEAYNRAEDLL